MLGQPWTWPLGGLKSPPSSGSPSVASCPAGACVPHTEWERASRQPFQRLVFPAEPQTSRSRDSKLAVSFLNSPPTKEGGIVTINNFKSLGVGIICDTAIGKCNSEHCHLRYGLPFWSPNAPSASPFPHRQHTQLLSKQDNQKSPRNPSRLEAQGLWECTVVCMADANVEILGGTTE